MSSDVYTDFDGTMIRKNAAVQLIKHYVFHGKGTFFSRMWKSIPLISPRTRRKRLSVYYEIVRSIPEKERVRILGKIPLNPLWKERVAHGKVTVSILSRNSISVIYDWLSLHKHELEDLHVHIKEIIANSPVDEDGISVVDQHDTHLKHIAFGVLTDEEKKGFLNKHVTYIGDREDEHLRPFVKEYIRV